MLFTPADVAARLAQSAEAVCHHYLPNGIRQGRYWIVGDARNTPGRSMFVRLTGPARGPGAAGKWVDAATGEHGDLLDLIRIAQGLAEFREVMDEARRFLVLPREPVTSVRANAPPAPAPTTSPEAARRLLALSRPIAGTLAEPYLRARGLHDLRDTAALRYHPRCYRLPDTPGPTETWPALIATVTDLDGRVTGLHRTWLEPSGTGKAPVETPRRAMGEIGGHAVRFGPTEAAVMLVGEGIETVLSLRQVIPGIAAATALSATNLAAVALPSALRRLYIARDDDPAGDTASSRLAERARAAGIEPVVLRSTLADFNDDLMLLGIEPLRANVRLQLAPEDAHLLGPAC